MASRKRDMLIRWGLRKLNDNPSMTLDEVGETIRKKMRLRMAEVEAIVTAERALTRTAAEDQLDDYVMLKATSTRS